MTLGLILLGESAACGNNDIAPNVGSVVDTTSAVLSSPFVNVADDEDADKIVGVAGVDGTDGAAETTAVTLAVAEVTIFEHIVVPSMDVVQNVFSLSALGEDTSTCK